MPSDADMGEWQKKKNHVFVMNHYHSTGKKFICSALNDIIVSVVNS